MDSDHMMLGIATPVISDDNVTAVNSTPTTNKTAPTRTMVQG